MEELYSGWKISSEACYYKDRIFTLEEKQKEGLCLVHGWNTFFPFEWFIPLFPEELRTCLKIETQPTEMMIEVTVQKTLL